MGKKRNSPSTSFKLDVAIRYFERDRGKRLYKVRNLNSDRDIFVGTREECGRYLQILQEKIDRQLSRKRLNRSLKTRVYRANLSDLSRAGI